MRFCHLKVRTEYSLLSSVLDIDKIEHFLRERCDNCVNNSRDRYFGICDESSLSLSLQFSTKLISLGIKPIIGLDVKVFFVQDSVKEVFSLPIFAKNANGYKNILNILYHMNCSEDKMVDFEIFKTLSKDIICLTGGPNQIIRKKFIQGEIEFCEDFIKKLKDLFNDNLYIEIFRYGLEKEKELEDFLLECSNKFQTPVVATNDCHFLNREQFEAFQCLICIRDKSYLIDDSEYVYNEEFYLKSEQEMIELFSDIPEALENSIEIAQRCSFYLQYRKPILPRFLEQGQDEELEFERLSKEGLEERFKEVVIMNYQIDKEFYKKRLDYELSVIHKMKFAGYFLIVSDFIKWSKENKIAVGPGRGSGAGSIIAWALRITNIDPIRYTLLFERFLNPDRVSMPDFDIDFCQERRHEVIEYIKKRYGENKIANIITFGKLHAKAALKDAGRTMHIPYVKLDNICKMIPFNPLEQITIEKALEMDPRLKEEKAEDVEIEKLIEIAMEIEGLNRNQSIHAAGIIISNEVIKDICPVDIDLDNSNPIICYDMKDIEKFGLLKFDFLGLKTLTVISKTCEYIKDKTLNIDLIPVDDEKTFELLRSGNLKGIFQFESAITRECLKKIKVSSIDELSDITSLARPGPMENIPNYIRRKIGEEKIDYYDDSLSQALKPTFGIIIYQEQVMQIAQILAGYTLAEADLLRRAMGKKIKEEMDAQRSIFVKKCEEVKIITSEKAEKMFDIIAKFAGYGFNKSHAVSYSYIAYQTAYLKAHYTVEFLTSNLNLEIDDTDKINSFILDAKVFNIEIIAPNINTSDAYFTFKDNKIFFGLAGIKGIGIKSADEIVKIRNSLVDGKFISLEDFAERCGKILNKKIIEALIFTGSLDDFGINRKTLIENYEKILDFHEQQQDAFSLFEIEKKLHLKQCEEFTKKELLNFEFESFGFYLSTHPLFHIKKLIDELNFIPSNDIPSLDDEILKKGFYASGVIIKVIQRFKNNNRFAFVHLTDFEGVYEVMVFSDKLINENRDLLEEGKSIILLIDGKRSDETGIRLLVKKIYSVQNFIENKELVLELKKAKDLLIKDEKIKEKIEKKQPVKLSTDNSKKDPISSRSKEEMMHALQKMTEELLKLDS